MPKRAISWCLVHPLQAEVVHLSANTTDELVVADAAGAIAIEGAEEAQLFSRAEAQVEAIEEPPKHRWSKTTVLNGT